MTRIAARIVQDDPRAINVLLTAHHKELVIQPRDTFAAFEMRAGIINAGCDFAPDIPLQIASNQALVGKLDAIKPPNLIILDKAHHATADMWKKNIGKFSEAIIIGLSGPPERADGTGLTDTF